MPFHQQACADHTPEGEISPVVRRQCGLHTPGFGGIDAIGTEVFEEVGDSTVDEGPGRQAQEVAPEDRVSGPSPM
jgi:hypothetical protein